MKKPLLTGLVGLFVAQPSMALDLIDAYEKALAYDSGIASARATYEAQQANVDVTRSNLLPQLDAVGTASHTDTDGPATDESYKSYTYGLELTQPVFRLDAWFNLDASEFQSESARADYSLAQQQLILDVATAYFNVLRAEDNLTTVKAAEAAFERQYDQAQERFEVGLIAITEVYESRASYDASKSERIAAEGDLDVAREQLSRLIGENAEDLQNLEQDFPLSRPQPMDPAAWENIALQQNWRIQSAAYQLQSNRSLLDVAKAGHYPTLDLSASYGNTEYDGINQQSPTQGTQDGTYTEGVIALNLNVPLYEGSGTEASIRQQRAQVVAAQESLNTVRRDVSVNTRSFYRTVNTNIESVNSQAQTIVSRRSALDATRAGYEVGTRNIVEVLDAERNYYEALRDYANARYDYVVNTLNLKLTAGTLSPQDLVDLNRWLSASAPGIEAIADESKTVDPMQDQ
ncbi:TolC family outer membrane protein [Marinobacter bohaiensis]|uniref:TolC family outer membrane protein n=1 Tax=Marinobacter bohaiensis TaxID=2201898 RepID=UPI000DAE0751|nr:TolC family outer membrane protein [Marinobacter bohaiensis]